MKLFVIALVAVLLTGCDTAKHAFQDYDWTVVKVNDSPDRPYAVAACYKDDYCDSLTGYRRETVSEAQEIADDLNHIKNHGAKIVQVIR